MHEYNSGFIENLEDGWAISILVIDDITTVRLTNEALAPVMYESIFEGSALFDLVYGSGFTPVIYHEGIDTPPLVCFHPLQGDEPVYVWETRLSRLYCVWSCL